jgi:hypothetical protein
MTDSIRIFGVHSRMLSLHSFQNLTMPAEIRAEAMAQEAKTAIRMPMTSLIQSAGFKRT